ncbi:MAG: chorismate mutase [Thermoprotei archaeon]
MSLDELRAKIDEIDYQIISLLAQRFFLSKKIGQIKSRSGLSIKDEVREAEVTRRWVENARKLGVPEELVREIVSKVLYFSKRVQIVNESPKRVTLVGYGGMSRSLARLLVNAENKVVITGRDPKKAEEAARETGGVYMPLDDALEWGDYVILALPPEAITGTFVPNLAPRLKGKTVMDVLSVKRGAFDFLEKLSREFSFRYVSTHPLFGPLSNPIGENIVIIPSRTSGDLTDVTNMWRSAGLSVVITDAETHDRAMAVVQVLSHFFVLALKESYERLSKELGVSKELDKLQTVTYKELLRIIERVSSQMDVTMEIQRNNPYAYIAREVGIKTVSELYERLEGRAVHPQERLGLVDPEGKDRQ